jgi:ABC-type polysaccharide/polyol phosphate export permease
VCGWPTRFALKADNPGIGQAVVLSVMMAAAAVGFEELIGEIRNWRVWHLLSINDLRHRYARSRFGQSWLTISTAAMVGVLSGFGRFCGGSHCKN